MRKLEQIRNEQTLLNNLQINIVEQINKSNKILIDIQTILNNVEQEKRNLKSTFTERQLNFKKDDDTTLIRKFRDEKYKVYKTDILEILVQRNNKKKNNYEKDKTERNKKLYETLKNFFIKQDEKDFIDALDNLMKQ